VSPESGPVAAPDALDLLDGIEPRPQPEDGDAPPQHVRLSPEAIAHAEAYNRGNIPNVVKLDRRTGGRYAKRNGELDAQGVADWQVDHGVVPDGCVGPLTIAALDHPGPAPTPKPTPTPDPRGSLHADVQRLMIRIALASQFDGPLVCKDAEVHPVVEARVLIWRQRRTDQEEGLRWIRKHEDGGWGDHPQVQELRLLCGRHPPMPMEITASDVGIWVAAAWDDLDVADQQIVRQYDRVRALQPGD
jgi:hypothetical protein